MLFNIKFYAKQSNLPIQNSRQMILLTCAHGFYQPLIGMKLNIFQEWLNLQMGYIKSPFDHCQNPRDDHLSP